MENVTLNLSCGGYKSISFTELKNRLEINIRPEYRTYLYDSYAYDVDDWLESMGLIRRVSKDSWAINQERLEEFEKLLDDLEAYARAQFESFKENN